VSIFHVIGAAIIIIGWSAIVIDAVREIRAAL